MSVVAVHASLLGLAFLAATVLPAQSEAALAGLLATGDYATWPLVATASLGNVAGSVVNWLLGRGVERLRHRRWFPVGEASLENWRWIMGINLWGVIHGCHVFAPRLIAQRGGAVLNVASAAGIACAPTMGPYNVTKSGVIALSETLAAELAPHGVGVTVLCPVFFKTNLLENLRVADPQQSGFVNGAALTVDGGWTSDGSWQSLRDQQR